MLFQKKIERSCDYCLHSAKLADGQYLCSMKGLRPQDRPCHRFSYDPCKRIPVKAKAMDFSKYNEEDYSL